MAGSGIWLDDATNLAQQGEMWAQNHIQGLQQQLQAGENWASQAIGSSLQQLQQMVPQISLPTPAAAQPPAPTPIQAPTPAAVTPPLAPASPNAPAIPTPSPTTPAAMPTAAAPVPTPPPAVGAQPSTADIGQAWAQQAIDNLTGPSVAPMSQPTPLPATPQPLPAPTPTGLPQSTDLTQASVGQPAPIGLPSPTAPPPAPAATPTTAPASNVPAGPQPKQPGDLIDQARQAAIAAGIDPDLFTRQINQESGFNPNAQSQAGAQGIAQLMPATASALGVDPMHPAEALPAAARLMRSYLDRYNGDWASALSAYNAGPGNVPAGGGVPNFTETRAYVNAILNGQSVNQNQLQGQPQQQPGAGAAVNTPAQGVQAAVARTSQFDLGLSSGDAIAFCGPAAALAFAQTYGRNPTVDEAKQLAQQVGWNPQQGMAGPQSEVSLLNAMGVQAHMTQGVDWATVGRDAQGGNPVIIDTPGHYYYVDGYNAQTGQLHVGTSGTDLKGGSEWMTPDQINNMPQSQGAARAAIFADHPLAQQDGMAQSQAASPIQQLLGQGQQLLTQGEQAVGQVGQNLVQGLQNVSQSVQQKAEDTFNAVLNVGSQAMQNLAQAVPEVLLSGQPTAPAPLNPPAVTQPPSGQDLSQQLLGAGANAINNALGVPGQLAANLGITSPADIAPPAIANALLNTAQTGMGTLAQGAGNLASQLGITSPAQITQPALANQLLGAVGTSALGGLLGGPGLPQGPAPAPYGGGLGQVGNALGNLPDTSSLLQAPNPSTPLGRVVAGQAIGNLSVPDQAQALMQLNQMYSAASEAATRAINPLRDVPVLGGLINNATNPEFWLTLAAGGQAGGAAQSMIGGTQGLAARGALEGLLQGGVYGAQQPSATAQDIAQAGLGGLAVGGAIPAGVAGLQSVAPYAGQVVQQALSNPQVRDLLTSESGGLNLDPLLQAAAGLRRVGAPGGGAPGGGAGPTVPGAPPPGPITWGERLASMHTASVISDLATVDKVAMNTVGNSIWSVGTRTLADLAGGAASYLPGGTNLPGVPGEVAGVGLTRAAGGVKGMIGALSGLGDAFGSSLSEVYNRPTGIAARADNPFDALLGRVTATPSAIHAALMGMGQNFLEHVELGRAAGEQLAKAGISAFSPDFADRWAALMANPTEDMLNAAQGVAQRAMLRGQLGGWGTTLGRIADVPGVGNALFPVYRIGMNALTQGVEKTPIGLAGTIFDVARGLGGAGPYAGGAFEQPVQRAVAPLSERLTNNLFGTALTAGLLYKGVFEPMSQGQRPWVTGPGPSDPDQRRALEGTGWQPNSINVPGVGYVSYMGTNLEVPLGLIGAVGDTLRTPLSPLEQTAPTNEVLGARLFGNVTNMLGTRSGLETIGQVYNLMQALATDPVAAARQFMTGPVASVVGGFVPASGLLRGVARATDVQMRQPPPGDLGQALMQNIPGLRQNVQPQLDVLGRPVANPQQGPAAFLPVRLAPGQPSPVLSAMAAAQVAPTATPQTVAFGPYYQFRLTPQERQAWEQYRGNALQRMAGTMVSSPNWQQMSPQSQRIVLQRDDQSATQIANQFITRDIAQGPGGTAARRIPTPGGLLSAVQPYGPAPQDNAQAVALRQAMSQALFNSLLSGQTGQQYLQDVYQLERTGAI